MSKKKLLIVILGVVAVAVVAVVIFYPFESKEERAERFYAEKGMISRTPPEPMFLGNEHRISTPGMVRELQELYKLSSLDSFIIQNVGMDVQGEFYFAEDVTASELQSAIRLGYEKLHLGVPNSIVPLAIDEWMQTTEVGMYFDNTDLLFYIGDELLLYHHYEKMVLTDKYENTAINLAARVDTELNDYINGHVIEAAKGMEASAQRSLMGRAIILQVRGEQLLNPDDYRTLINRLEGDSRLHALAPGRSHVVLVLVDGQGRVYSEDVFESTESGLAAQDIDWMALKPY